MGVSTAKVTPGIGERDPTNIVYCYVEYFPLRYTLMGSLPAGKLLFISDF